MGRSSRLVCGSFVIAAAMGCGTSEEYCDDCGPCGIGPVPGVADPVAIALTTNEETAFVASNWSIRWGECGYGGYDTQSVHVVDLVLGTAHRIDLPDIRVFDLAAARGEVVLVHDDGYRTMPTSAPFVMVDVPLAGSPHDVRRVADVVFLRVGTGAVLRHAAGEMDFFLETSGSASWIVSAFGRLWAGTPAGVDEINSSGSILRTLAAPCEIDDAVAVAPSHLLIACDDGSIALVDTTTEAFEIQLPPADVQFIAGSEELPVALAAYDGGTLAVIPANGLPAGEVTSGFGSFPQTYGAVFFRNGNALAATDSGVWRLTLSTNGAAGYQGGYLVGPAVTYGTAHVLVSGGDSSFDYDEPLSEWLSTVNVSGAVDSTIRLEGPPPGPLE